MEQNIKNELTQLINLIDSVPNGDKLLTDIFEIHFSKGEYDIIESIQSHLNDAFQTNSLSLFSYLQTAEYLKKSDLNITKDDTLNAINNIKRKYGFEFKMLKAKNENPFLLKGMGITFSNKESLYNATFIRYDGEKLDAMVSAQSILNIVNLSSVQLDNILKNGIYNLDINTIKMYLEISGKLSEQLEKLLKNING